MKAGFCIVCGNPVMKGRVPTSNYAQSKLALSSGDFVIVSHCRGCKIVQSAYSDLTNRLRDGGYVLSGDVSGIVSRETISSILKETKICSLCGEPLGDCYHVNAGRLVHERCHVEPKQKLIETVKYKRAENTRVRRLGERGLTDVQKQAVRAVAQGKRDRDKSSTE